MPLCLCAVVCSTRVSVSFVWTRASTSPRARPSRNRSYGTPPPTSLLSAPRPLTPVRRGEPVSLGHRLILPPPLLLPCCCRFAGPWSPDCPPPLHLVIDCCGINTLDMSGAKVRHTHSRSLGYILCLSVGVWVLCRVHDFLCKLRASDRCPVSRWVQILEEVAEHLARNGQKLHLANCKAKIRDRSDPHTGLKHYSKCNRSSRCTDSRAHFPDF